MNKTQKGFTLIELLIVIGIIAVLAGVVLVALNPARQFAQANDTTRTSHVNQILGAIGARIVDTRGVFENDDAAGDPNVAACAAGALPDADDNPNGLTMGDATSVPAGYDIAPCLVPAYIPSMPVDPQNGTWTDTTTYDTNYTVRQTDDGQVTVCAPSTEIGDDICVTR